MRRRVVLKQNGKKVPAVKGKPLTTKFRAHLYLAYDAMNGRKFAQSAASTQGVKREIGLRSRDAIEKSAVEWEKEIGPEWTKRLKQGYSGLSFKDLIESFNYGRLYPVYRIMSAGVHATNSTDFIEFDESAENGVRFRASASVEGVAKTLKLASALVIHLLEAADKRLGLGIKKKCGDLMKKVEGMRIEFPQ